MNKKNFGLNSFLLWSILLLGLFLRFYRLFETAMFVGDQGRDYLAARDIILDRRLTFVGPQTSIPWLYLGPFFYYFLALFLILGKFNPIWPVLGTAFFGVLGVYLIFILGRRLFNEKVGLLSAFFYAISPYAVLQSRISLHPSIYPFFVILYFLSLMENLNQKRKKILWALILVASFLVAVQLHLSAILLIPISLLIYDSKVRRPIFGLKKLFLKIFLISVFSLCLYKILMGSPFTPWFYWWRIFEEIFNYGFSYGTFLSLGIAILGLWWLIKQKKLEARALLIFFLLTVCGLTIKNSSAEHYFNLFLPIIVLIFACGFNQLPKIKYGKPAAFLISMFYLICNVYNLLSSGYFYKYYGPGMAERIKLAEFIVNDIGGEEFILGRRGPLWDFASTNNNYEYLIWWLGGKYQKENQSSAASKMTKYLIIEPFGARDGIRNEQELRGEFFDLKFSEVIKLK